MKVFTKKLTRMYYHFKDIDTTCPKSLWEGMQICFYDPQALNKCSFNGNLFDQARFGNLVYTQAPREKYHFKKKDVAKAYCMWLWMAHDSPKDDGNYETLAMQRQESELKRYFSVLLFGDKKKDIFWSVPCDITDPYGVSFWKRDEINECSQRGNIISMESIFKLLKLQRPQLPLKLQRPLEKLINPNCHQYDEVETTFGMRNPFEEYGFELVDDSKYLEYYDEYEEEFLRPWERKHGKSKDQFIKGLKTHKKGATSAKSKSRKNKGNNSKSDKNNNNTKQRAKTAKNKNKNKNKNKSKRKTKNNNNNNNNNDNNNKRASKYGKNTLVKSGKSGKNKLVKSRKSNTRSSSSSRTKPLSSKRSSKLFSIKSNESTKTSFNVSLNRQMLDKQLSKRQLKKKASNKLITSRQTSKSRSNSMSVSPSVSSNAPIESPNETPTYSATKSPAKNASIDEIEESLSLEGMCLSPIIVTTYVLTVVC